MSLENMTADEGTGAELNLDDLEGAAGGRGRSPLGSKYGMHGEKPKKPTQPAQPDRVVFCVDCGASYMASQGHDCPEG